MRLVLILLLIVAVGAILRFSNISVYKFYPDAYQNLLVAQNIKSYQSVVGYMGEGGLLFPQYFLWSRPVYPILINLADVFVHDSSKAATWVVLFAGILAIPVVFLLITRVFGSKLAGLAGAGIIAISFNHSIWGGFILSETIGVLMLLISLFVLFKNLKFEPKLLNKGDLATGFFLAVSIFSRFEYAIVLLPISLFIFSQSKKPFTRFVNIGVAAFFVSSLFLSLLFPVSQVSEIVFAQLNELLVLGAIITALTMIIAIGNLLLSEKQKRLIIVLTSNISIGAIVALSGIIAISSSSLDGLRTFFRTDFILGILALIGTIWMLLLPKYRAIAFFVIFSSFALGIIYFKVNPQMQRYGTHLIPFLLIPASFALSKLLRIIFNSMEKRELKTCAALVIILISSLGFQIFLTYNGMKHWDSGDWYRQSYEEKAAKTLTSKIGDKNIVLIASFPEAYYYFSKITTQSIADSPPFVYIDEWLNSRDAIVVLDMGMRDVFPNFANFITGNLQQYKAGEFWVGETYRYLAYWKVEEFPVEIYKIKLADLKDRINKASN